MLPNIIEVSFIHLCRTMIKMLYLLMSFILAVTTNLPYFSTMTEHLLEKHREEIVFYSEIDEDALFLSPETQESVPPEPDSTEPDSTESDTEPSDSEEVEPSDAEETTEIEESADSAETEETDQSPTTETPSG